MITINDSVKIKKTNIGGEDIFVLTNLYMPIIGMDSLSLYLFFNSCNDEILVRTILDFTHITNMQGLNNAINKLEGIGLLKKYHHENKGFLYEMERPVSKKSFKNTPILVHTLLQFIDKTAYESIIKENKYIGYKEVTKSFDEVFQKNKIISTSFTDITKQTEENIKIKNDKFDYLIFKLSFEDDALIELLNDSHFEKEILKISYQYNLNEEEMKKAVTDTISYKGDLTISELNNQAQRVFQNKKSNALNFPVKKPKAHVVELTSDENIILSWATTKPIGEFIELFSGGKASLVDVRDYNKLKDLFNVKEEVMNILYMHITGLKKGENTSYNYIEKVLSSWIKSGVTSAKDALIHIRDEENTKEKKTKTYKSASMDTWMTENNEEETSFIDDETKRKVFG